MCGFSNAISEASSPPPPEFIAHRESLWQEFKKKYDQYVASQPRSPIEITLPDGSMVEGKAWETRPIDIARNLESVYKNVSYYFFLLYCVFCTFSKRTSDTIVISKVNGKLWDLERPFEGNASVSFLNFEDKDGQYVFWHSSAHVMGEAIERIYGGHLCYGPPIEEGFYYDVWMEGR